MSTLDLGYSKTLTQEVLSRCLTSFRDILLLCQVFLKCDIRLKSLMAVGYGTHARSMWTVD